MEKRIFSKSAYFYLAWIYSIIALVRYCIISLNYPTLSWILKAIIISITLLFTSHLSGYCVDKAPVIIRPKVLSSNGEWIFKPREVLTNKRNTIAKRKLIYSVVNKDDQNISTEPDFGTHTDKLIDQEYGKSYFITSEAIKTPGLSYGIVIEDKELSIPVFLNKIIATVNYGEVYHSLIKVQSTGNQIPKISLTKKPGWMSLRSEAEVQTFAGSGRTGSTNGPALSASFRAPYALASDTRGNIYIADQLGQNIRKISISGEVSLLAGGNESGYQNGMGNAARFSSPSGIAIDASGNVYVSDQNNHCIRKITPSGLVSTLAGNGSPGYTDGASDIARFKYPAGLAVDPKGNVYVADRGNNTVRMISPNGTVSTLAGTRATGFADGPAASAVFNAPTGLAIGSSGDVFIADQVNNRIRKIDIYGQVSTIAGSGTFIYADGEGKLAGFRYPTGIIVGNDGSLFITDQLNHNIRRISKDGMVSTVAGAEPGFSEGTGSSAKFRNPSGICTVPSGELYIADFYNYRIRKINNDPVLFGTPAKSDVGSNELVLTATNEAGTATQTINLLVLDVFPPQLNSFSPANGAISVSRSPDLMLTFDEEVFLSDTGSVTIVKDSEVLKKLDLKVPDQRAKLVLSSDRKSLHIEDVNNLPANSTIRILFSKGLICDFFKNEFNGLAKWSFKTKNMENQLVNLQSFPEKVYGDTSFIVGPELSSAGLPMLYLSDDPSVLNINGNIASIIKAGSTKLTAIQKGNSDFQPLEIKRDIIVKTRPISVQPLQGQGKKYVEPDFEIGFQIKSGTLLNGDQFTGKLSREKGDTVGVYPINAGTLALNPNYSLIILPGEFSISKAALRIIADDKIKVIGKPDPEYTVSYIGFVNGDGIESLTSKPRIISSVGTDSLPGSYKLIVDAASAKNYDITFQEGTLKIIYPEVSDFYLEAVNLFENRPSSTLAGILKTTELAKLSYSLVRGEGDSDNDLFKIENSRIMTTAFLDYESKKKYFIRVRATSLYGDYKDKELEIAITDINEMPQMDDIPDKQFCMTGTIDLKGISGGAESEQEVKISIKSPDIDMFSILNVSEVISGKAKITYSISKSTTRKARLEIMLKDDGGVKNGGTDSVVYHYTLSFPEPPTLSLTSDKGLSITKGEAILLTANGNGTYSWSDDKGVINTHNSPFLRINPTQSTVYKVRMTSESGCVIEKSISILVKENQEVACYNVITPNEDGKNDFFTVKNIDLYPQNDLKVFDKSGTIVYAQKNYRNEWKGDRNGMALPTGTYYYLFELGPGQEKFKGFVLILND